MSSPQNPSSAAPSAAAMGLVCPACQHAVQRRPRHLSDRLLALCLPGAMPLRRYACTEGNCSWQGLLRGRLSRRPGYLPQQWL